MTIDTIKDVLGRIISINKNLTEESLRNLLVASGWDSNDIQEGLNVYRSYGVKVVTPITPAPQQEQVYTTPMQVPVAQAVPPAPQQPQVVQQSPVQTQVIEQAPVFIPASQPAPAPIHITIPTQVIPQQPVAVPQYQAPEPVVVQQAAPAPAPAYTTSNERPINIYDIHAPNPAPVIETVPVTPIQQPVSQVYAPMAADPSLMGQSPISAPVYASIPQVVPQTSQPIDPTQIPPAPTRKISYVALVIDIILFIAAIGLLFYILQNK